MKEEGKGQVRRDAGSVILVLLEAQDVLIIATDGDDDAGTTKT